jgi:metal-responsive CopG/Arc/MetJ family transcriptional regulator
METVTMRTSENFSITFPADMLKRVKERAKQENRTMSELLREAYREYERKRRWEEINAYGRERAAALGIKEEDVLRIVKEFRKEQRLKANKRER